MPNPRKIHTEASIKRLQPPPYAVKRGYLVPVLLKNGRVRWSNGRGVGWAAWPEEKDRRLKELYRRGMTTKVMCHELNISKEQLGRRIAKLKLVGTTALRRGVERRPKVQIAVTSTQKRRLAQLATQKGMSTSNYIRLLILRDLGG